MNVNSAANLGKKLKTTKPKCQKHSGFAYFETIITYIESRGINNRANNIVTLKLLGDYYEEVQY